MAFVNEDLLPNSQTNIEAVYGLESPISKTKAWTWVKKLALNLTPKIVITMAMTANTRGIICIVAISNNKLFHILTEQNSFFKLKFLLLKIIFSCD